MQPARSGCRPPAAIVLSEGIVVISRSLTVLRTFHLETSAVSPLRCDIDTGASGRIAAIAKKGNPCTEERPRDLPGALFNQGVFWGLSHFLGSSA